MLHLYPDLNLGARRSVSRFHVQRLNQTVPWMLSRPEDLARGADLKAVDDQTVALIPHNHSKKKWIQIHYVFSKAGPIQEQQIVEMPSKKVLLREVYSADGTMKLLDKDDKVLVTIKGQLKLGEQKLDAFKEPKDLVILPLPYRSSQHVLKTRKLEKKNRSDYSSEDLIALFAAHFGEGQTSSLQTLFRSELQRRNHRKLGFYLLLAASGANLDSDHLNVHGDHLRNPLAQYLTLHTSPVLRKHASQWAVGSGQWDKGFTGFLARSHAMFQRWSTDRFLSGDAKQRQQEINRAMEYLRANKNTIFGWTLLCKMQDRALAMKPKLKSTRELFATLAGACELFMKMPGLNYAVRYEKARNLLRAGETKAARNAMQILHAESIKRGLPLLDSEMRDALLPEVDLIQTTADALIKKKAVRSLFVLAHQARALGDLSMTRLILERIPKLASEKSRNAYIRAIAHFYADQLDQPERADALVRELLKDENLAKDKSLWDFAHQLARKRDMPARALHCLERSNALFFSAPSEVIDLREVRAEHHALLNEYGKISTSLRSLNLPLPDGFLQKVIRVADQWRAVDPGYGEASTMTAQILRLWGQHDLAWDYLTTPVGLEPYDASRWQGLAQTLKKSGERKLADLAYASAFSIEPTNAQILYDRAMNLRESGREAEARNLFRQLVDGQWQPRFRSLQSQAKWQLR